MNLRERPLDQLKICQMRPGELQKYLIKSKDQAKKLRELSREIEKEILSRPKTKTYPPGLYWGHTAYYSSYSGWFDGEEELVIIDQEGFPWIRLSNKWHRFGLSMNDTAERIWERIGDI